MSNTEKISNISLDKISTSVHPPMAKHLWGSVIGNTYGVDLRAFVYKIETKVSGVIPYYVASDFSGKKFLRSLKDGLQADSEEVASLLIEELITFASKNNISEISLSSSIKKFHSIMPSVEKTTLLFMLNQSIAETWDTLRAKTRNSIRKAEKEGITIERGPQFINDFYNGYSERLLEKKVSFHSLDFFENIIKYFENDVELIVAKYRGEVIGSIILIYSGDQAIYAYNGTNIHKPVSPNQLLLWEGVKSCFLRGCKVLDLSESSVGSGVYNFKKNFGGVPTPVYYYKKVLKTSKPGFYYRLRNKIISMSYEHLPQKLQFKICCWKRKFEVLQ